MSHSDEDVRAEAERRYPAFRSVSTGNDIWPRSVDAFVAGAKWAASRTERIEDQDG